MSILGNRILGGAGQQPYLVGRSLRFRASASAYLNRTPASASNQKTWTWSGWVKRGALTSGGNFGLFGCGSNASLTNTALAFGSDSLGFQYYTNSPSVNLVWSTSAVYRDSSAWYHVVLVLDTTQASSSNAVKIYINGVQQTLTFTSYAGSYTQNQNYFVNSTNQHTIGQTYTGFSYFYDGYFAEVNFIDGQALTPSSFGAYDNNGVWQPIKYGGTYGTNGFYLPFSNTTSTTTLVQDSSGNGNNWTPNNISLTAGTTYDSMIDSPTNAAGTSTGIGNYPVVLKNNPLTTSTVSNGNLDITSGSEQKSYISFNMPLTGKWYFEFTANTFGASNAGFWLHACGYGIFGMPVQGAYRLLNDTVSIDITVSGSGTPSNGDVYKCAFDADTGRMWWGVNSLWFANAGNTTSNPSTNSNPSFTGVTPTDATAIIWSNQTGGGLVNCTGSWNFGQRPFSYTPPTGFNALNTYNLPQPTIMNGAKYMAATTYTGNGSSLAVANSANNTTGVVFQPDFVWVKWRGGTANHILVDSVRGVTKDLSSNLTNAETTVGDISALNSNGFTATYVTGETNANGLSYIGWQWNAGSGTTSTNTNGSISSLVSVNPSAGFSIVSYVGNGTAGATVGHSLGVAPSLMLVKNRSTAGQNWLVYSSSLGATKCLFLDLTNAATTVSTPWNDTAPTSSVFSVGTSSGSNSSSAAYIAYCWSAVAGYSAFGSYTGNASTDGPFVYTGHRPRWLMIKRTDSVASWYVYDSSRNTYNTMNNWLAPNVSDAENTATTWEFDFLSNGFKVRNSGAFSNASGGTYIYAAFAENPFKISRAR